MWQYLTCVKPHVTSAEYRGLGLWNDKVTWHHKCWFHDMWYRDVIWAVRLRLNMNHWFQSMERRRGSGLWNDKVTWHQEFRFHDMWNHNVIWAVRLRLNLNHWFQSIERHRGLGLWSDKNTWQQEPRNLHVRFRDLIASLGHFSERWTDVRRQGGAEPCRTVRWRTTQKVTWQEWGPSSILHHSGPPPVLKTERQGGSGIAWASLI